MPLCEPRLSADGSLFVASYRPVISTLGWSLRRAGKGGVGLYGVVRMVHRSPRTSTRRIARCLSVPHTRVWRTLHADGMYPYHVQRVQHLRPGDFAERLNFCKWLNGSSQLHRYIMFTEKSNLIATVSIIHTILMCGQMRIPTPLLKATFNNVSVSMCGVQFWTIS